MCKHSKSDYEIGTHGLLQTYERWVIYLFFGLMSVIAFQVIARRILKYARMSSRAVLHVEGILFFWL
jgi:hypothetical protein